MVQKSKCRKNFQWKISLPPQGPCHSIPLSRGNQYYKILRIFLYRTPPSVVYTYPWKYAYTYVCTRIHTYTYTHIHKEKSHTLPISGKKGGILLQILLTLIKCYRVNVCVSSKYAETLNPNMTVLGGGASGRKFSLDGWNPHEQD